MNATSVPLHLLVERSLEQERELAHLVVEQPHYLEWYAALFSTLHPEAWKEIKEMAATKRKGLHWDFSAVVEDIGMTKLVESLGIDRVIDAIGPKRMIERKGVDWLIANLPPADLKKLKERLK